MEQRWLRMERLGFELGVLAELLEVTTDDLARWVVGTLGVEQSDMIEVGLISVIGGLLGWAAGMLASFIALPYFAESEPAFQLHPMLAVVAIGAGLLIGIASSFYPIVRASRLDPSEAVRYI